MYVAGRFGCHLDCYDSSSEFVQNATNRTEVLGLASNVSFTNRDVNNLEVTPSAYDAGVCLGALYMFRDAGWKALVNGVKPGGFLVVSDLHCKKVPAPKEVMEVFFEEEDQPLTLEDARHLYTSRGVKILREEECSRKVWLDYYDLTRKMLLHLAKKYSSDDAKQAEIEEALREDRLVRDIGEEYLGYRTFVMQKLSANHYRSWLSNRFTRRSSNNPVLSSRMDDRRARLHSIRIFDRAQGPSTK